MRTSWTRAGIAGTALVILGCGDGGAAAPVDARGDGGPSGWSPAPAVRGGPIQETAAVAVDGRLYVIGGITGGGGFARAVRIFDTATQTWSDGPDLPVALHHVQAAAVDGRIFVLGGLSGAGFTAVGQVWSWHPASEAGWSERRPMPAGTERGAGVTGVIDGDIVIAGGYRSGAVADVSIYDPGEDQWRAGPDLPAVRDHACGGVIGDVLYVAGGRTGAVQSIVATVYALEPLGGWTDRAAMPTARGGTACGVVDGRLLVAGGEGNSGAASGVFPQVEAFDPADNAWTSLEEMPTPRHGMAAAAWDGRLYVPGGADRQFLAAVDTHEVFTP
jgi:N-acetylneuraminic acid mutarotase